MKKFKWYAYMLLVMGTFMVSCSDDENSANKQTEVKFYLTDAPTSENYKAVNIDIKEVRYSIDGETWENLPITEATYNLLDFTNGKDTLISNITLLEGEHVSQIRLILGDDNELVLEDGTVVPITTPSAQESGLKFNVQENILTSSGYAVMIDFDASKSIVKKGNGGYSLKPVIRAYVVENTAAVYGNILPAKVPYHVFTVVGQDTISAISDTTLNNYFMLHGLKTGTYKVEFQSLDSDIVLFSTNVDVFGGTNKDLGIINLAQ